jgi:hypothetical protein
MDWTNIVNGLGNFGDIMGGKESYNSIKRGNQNYALGQDTIAQQANLAQQQRALQQLLQQQSQSFQAGENVLIRKQNEDLQKNQQAFLGDQNFFNRMQDSSDRSSNRAMQMSENAMDRAARLQAEQDKLNAGVKEAEMQYGWGNRNIDPAVAQMFGLPSNVPMRDLSVGGQAGGALANANKINGLIEMIRQFGGGGNGAPRGIPAKGPGAPPMRLKLGGGNN